MVVAISCHILNEQIYKIILKWEDEECTKSSNPILFLYFFFFEMYH